jgi:hypothetical protein
LYLGDRTDVVRQRHMPETRQVAVSELALDLTNYRTVPQPNDVAAVEAMISTSPDRFWALAESLLQDGYLPTESIIVLRAGPPADKLTVKEGNRRVAALKLAHKLLPLDTFSVPDGIAAQIRTASEAWRRDNSRVPCTIYEAVDAAIVDRIVTLAHGKGEKAGRDQWNAVARARHNRQTNGASEPALDLLEKYFVQGKNVTEYQRTRWAGAFPVSVLGEAMKRLAPRVGLSASPALATQYPAINYRDAVEAILHDIGLDRLGFEGIRQKETDFAARYGIPPLTSKRTTKPSHAAESIGTGKKKPVNAAPPVATAHRAVATGDPRATRRLLRDFEPRGKKREKVVALRNEAMKLDLRDTPLAFCFVLRSMFEISSKAYCADHTSSGGPSVTKSNGQEKPLVDVLRDITQHLTSNKSDKEKVKQLHGAMTELGRSEGLLSVTSMNQLIHHPRFSVAPSDIGVLFGNIFPLLEAMNS